MRSATSVDNDVAQGYVSRSSARSLYAAVPASPKARSSVTVDVEEAGEILGSE